MPVYKNYNTETKICTNCNKDKNINNYYLSRIDGQDRMDVCKDCFCNEFQEKGILEICNKYNIPYIEGLWQSAVNEAKNNDDTSGNIIKYYIKNVNSFHQYKNLQWKDSQFDTKENQEVHFYQSIVKNLKLEAQKLNQKLEKVRKNDDMNLYISTLKSLKETLELISMYDLESRYTKKPRNISKPIPMYVDVLRSEGDKPTKVIVFYNGEELLYEIPPLTFKDCAAIINDIVQDKDVSIYVDCHSVGLAMYDELTLYPNLNIDKIILRHAFRRMI